MSADRTPDQRKPVTQPARVTGFAMSGTGGILGSVAVEGDRVWVHLGPEGVDTRSGTVSGHGLSKQNRPYIEVTLDQVYDGCAIWRVPEKAIRRIPV